MSTLELLKLSNGGEPEETPDGGTTPPEPEKPPGKPIPGRKDDEE